MEELIIEDGVSPIDFKLRHTETQPTFWQSKIKQMHIGRAITFSKAAGKAANEKASPFARMDSLQILTFSKYVKSIPDYFLYNSSKSPIKGIVLGDSVESIGKYAFSGCDSLNTIVIGSSLKSIGRSAFNIRGGTNVYIFSDKLENIGSSVGYNTSKTMIYVLQPSTYQDLFADRMVTVKSMSSVQSTESMYTGRPIEIEILNNTILNINYNFPTFVGKLLLSGKTFLAENN